MLEEPTVPEEIISELPVKEEPAEEPAAKPTAEPRKRKTKRESEPERLVEEGEKVEVKESVEPSKPVEHVEESIKEGSEEEAVTRETKEPEIREEGPKEATPPVKEVPLEEAAVKIEAKEEERVAAIEERGETPLEPRTVETEGTFLEIRPEEKPEEKEVEVYQIENAPSKGTNETFSEAALRILGARKDITTTQTKWGIQVKGADGEKLINVNNKTGTISYYSEEGKQLAAQMAVLRYQKLGNPIVCRANNKGMVKEMADALMAEGMDPAAISVRIGKRGKQMSFEAAFPDDFKKAQERYQAEQKKKLVAEVELKSAAPKPQLTREVE
ncbi:MAG: hypothetical protein JW855_01655 [Gammaproteobacteria bacterium]|nr:hypothetical protein [Gammaproteobacteria bacterium]